MENVSKFVLPIYLENCPCVFCHIDLALSIIPTLLLLQDLKTVIIFLDKFTWKGNYLIHDR
jgi:hypothetical protein